jgi:excisionase family DNA binding protein
MAELVGLLTIKDAAERLAISEDNVLHFIKAGELRRVDLSIRPSGRGRTVARAWRIHPSDLEAFINWRRGYEPEKLETPVPVPEPRVVAPVACGTDGKVRLKRPRKAM